MSDSDDSDSDSDSDSDDDEGLLYHLAHKGKLYTQKSFHKTDC